MSVVKKGEREGKGRRMKWSAGCGGFGEKGTDLADALRSLLIVVFICDGSQGVRVNFCNIKTFVAV